MWNNKYLTFLKKQAMWSAWSIDATGHKERNVACIKRGAKF